MDETTHETRTDVLPKYELLSVDADGNEVRRYRDGSTRDQRGRTLAFIPGGNELITAETARAYHAKRKAKILAAIESKLTDITRTTVPADAIAAIVGKRAEIAMNDDTRTGNDAAKIVLSAVDAYQDKAPHETTNTQRHEYTMDAETRALLEAVLRERRENTDGDAEE